MRCERTHSARFTDLKQLLGPDRRGDVPVRIGELQHVCGREHNLLVAALQLPMLSIVRRLSEITR